jgi:hypothetical protein
MAFLCSVCGERHAERMLDIRMSLPDPIYDLDAGDRRRRAWLADDFAVLDESRFFVRGLLEVPIPELESRFGFGAWLEVEQSEFQQLLQQWKEPEQFPPVVGTLANELGPYTATTGLRAILYPTTLDELPSVGLEDAEHELFTDQRNGISVARSDVLAAAVLHT